MIIPKAMAVTWMAASVISAAVAQTASPVAAPAPSAPTPCTNCIPKLTPVELVIDSEMGSKLSTTGAAFPLHLAKPIVIDGKEAVPAGAVGEGEVIHAKKAGRAGAAGELVLAAKFLMVGDRQIRLRSMRIAVAGKDAIGAVDGVNAAAAGAAVFVPAPVALIGFAIKGKNIVLPAGTLAVAKTAEDFPLAFPAAAPPAPAPVSMDTKGGNPS